MLKKHIQKRQIEAIKEYVGAIVDALETSYKEGYLDAKHGGKSNISKAYRESQTWKATKEIKTTLKDL